MISILLTAMRWLPAVRSYVFGRLGERGQDLIEYAVLAGAIGVAAGAVLLFAPIPDSIANFGEEVASCVGLGSFDDGDGCNGF